MANMGLFKKNGRWRIRGAVNTKDVTWTKTVWCDSKHEAKRLLIEMEELERQIKTGEVTLGKSIEETIELFFQIKHVEGRGKALSDRTRGEYSRMLNKFFKYLPSSIRYVNQIETMHIQSYLQKKHSRGAKNRTLNIHLTAIKSFCRFYSEEYNLDNPAAKVEYRKEAIPKQRVLSLEEYKRVLRYLESDPENQNLVTAKYRFLFIAHTGLRASEFGSLRPESINENQDVIVVIGKGNKQRPISLNQTAREILPFVKPCTKNALYLQFTRIAKKVGIPSFGPHALRHFWVTQLINNGENLAKVSLMAGHATAEITLKVYTHLLPQDFVGLTNVLDSL